MSIAVDIAVLGSTVADGVLPAATNWRSPRDGNLSGNRRKRRMEMVKILKEIAELQKSYQDLVNTRKLTKKAMCDLCIPFRDAHHLTDLQVLRIARNEMEIGEMASLFE